MDVEINEVAVLVAAVVAMVVGMVWYHPKVFGNTWMSMAKIKMGTGSMGWSMGSAVVSSLVMAYVLAHVTYLSNQFFKHDFLQDALTTAFWMWLGFQGLRFFMHDQFNQRRKKETLIHMGNDLVTIMAMAVVIGVMGVK